MCKIFFYEDMTEFLQQITVGTVFLVLIIFIIYKFYNTNKNKKKITFHSNCADCAGCDLKELMQKKKQANCKDFREK